MEQKVSQIVKVGNSVKDFSWTNPSQKSEKHIKDRVEIIIQYHKRLNDIFGTEDEGGPQCLEQLEVLMMAQISLMKIYNKIPVEIYDRNCETMYPVTLAISMIQNIFKIGDVFTSQTNVDSKINLRSKFLKSDGLKYIFGVRIVDQKCANPDTLQKKAKQSESLKSQLRQGNLLHDFIITLTNDKKS